MGAEPDEVKNLLADVGARDTGGDGVLDCIGSS